MDAADLKRLKAAGMVREGRTVGEALARVAEQEAAPRAASPFSCTLPYPPSANHYRRFGTRVSRKTGKPFTSLFLTKKGKEYRESVKRRLRGVVALDGPLAIEITTHPPDGLRRDIDNVLKCLLDAMQHAGVYEDDNQIARLLIARGRRVRGGSVEVRLTRMATAQPNLFEGR